MVITTQGQRDARWASKILGYNTGAPYTLGNYGCLLTVFSMYLCAIGKEETPDTVNEKIKALKDANGKPNGFSNGGLLVWSSPERVWGIKLVYQSPYYAGPVTAQGKAKMKALLDEKRPLICHVDFDPNDPDDDMHWVLVTDYDGDNFFCNDPWTGQHVNIDVYGGSVDRAVLEFRAYDPVVTSDATVMIPVDSKTFENLVRKSTAYDHVLAKLNTQDSETIVQAELEKLISYEDVVGSKDKLLGEANDKIILLEAKISELTKNNEDMLAAQAKLTEKTAEQTKTIKGQKVAIDSLSTSIDELKKQITTPVYKGWKAALINFIGKL